MFCPTCRGITYRRLVGAKVVVTCARCGDVPRGKDAKPAAPASTPPAARTRPADLPDTLGRLFPYAEVREGQRDFLLDAHAAIAGGKHLLANAPTGIGKTVSSLVAALAVAKPAGKRVFFLTSKQSQHRIVVDTLAAIKDASGEKLVVVDMIAKQDMCPRPEARGLGSKRFAEFCRREQVTKSCEHFVNATKSEQGVALLAQKIRHVEDAVRALDRIRVCPHQAGLDAAGVADVVVCDYNYLFSDMRAGMQERLRLDLAKVVLVVDEAHNLADRIRDHLALEVTGRLLDEARDELARIDEDHVARLLTFVAEALVILGEEATAAGKEEILVPRERWVEAVNAALARGRGLLVVTDYDGLLKGIGEAAAAYEKEEQAQPRGLARLAQFLENWRVERRGLARILRRDGLGEWTLQYQLLDPAILAKPVFDAVSASVLMSGTLHPTEAARDVLGLDSARALPALYLSPFARANRLVLADTSVTTEYKQRGPDLYARIATNLAAATDEVPGHVAAFFPSYALLENVNRFLDAGRDVVVEERGADKEAKERLVADLRSANRAKLLLGVQGGSLSEGYDYEDNLLKGVAIVGLPLPPPSLAMDALIAYGTQKFGPVGREYAYTYPAMNRVLQAAGRLIRGPEDRGVVLLMDRRFVWGQYKRCYPPDFEPRETQEPAREVRRFFRGRDPTGS